MASSGNDVTFRFTLPATLHGPAESDAVRRAVLECARDEGAVSIGDLCVVGRMEIGDALRSYSVRVRLFFGGPRRR
ncbi:hypothetical protein GS4_05_00500 [Gordonia soli NBRC 108243]|uniref:Uncharacterized protein n=1 Tax=Gordonia soli NBRC 108243 TaxID=1223545 RepID=M0QEV6_9ACTN|nr:hypothetical protein GS4_05_00500 [Gordonia soli NBRC 108243]